MIKLIACDMDGTFLDDEHRYDETRFSALLDQLEERGILFAVASGRSLISLEELFSAYLDRIAFVAENGAIVTYKGQILNQTLMESHDYLPIAAKLDEMSDCYGYMLSGRHGAYAPPTINKDFLAKARQYYAHIRVEDLAQVSDHVYKLTAHLTAQTISERVEEISRIRPGIRAVTTGFEGIDIIFDSVNKATGLEALCQHLGLTADQVMAFGDNGNDLEMLAFAGKAIATENAKDEVKAVADEVIGHCKNQAVQTYLEEWLHE